MLYRALGVVLLSGILITLVCRHKPEALLVLAYEKIGTAPNNSPLKKEWTTVNQFKKTLLWLRAHGFTPINAGRLNSSATRPPKPVLLVFMGGYKSFLTDIFPLLQDSKTPATLFLPTNATGTYNKWQDPRQYHERCC